MKKFEAPELEILKFSVVDVITTSGEEELPENYENMAGWY